MDWAGCAGGADSHINTATINSWEINGYEKFYEENKMNSPSFNSFYKDVPEEQRGLFLDFLEDHPYSTIPFRGKDFKYISYGQVDKTLVFLHGAFVRPDMWFYPIIKLEEKFRIIVPLFPPQGMGVQEAADFVRSILEKKNISKAIFIGYSYGGGVAQYFAEKYPELVDKLILSHTGLLRREDGKQKLARAHKILRITPFFLVKLLFKKRIAYCPDSNWNDFHQAYFEEIFSKLGKTLLLEYLANSIKSTEDLPENIEHKRKWQGKTIIFGTKDDKDAFKYVDSLKELYSNSDVYVFDQGGGHHMIFLFPEKYSRILSQYLK
jgi:pimeloyl-ACP methyl ester carboxylesterase